MNQITLNSFGDELEKIALPIQPALFAAAYTAEGIGNIKQDKKKLKEAPTAGQLSTQMNYSDF